MRKLKLHLEDLAVQSFSPAPVRLARGTAHAHAADTVLPEEETGTQPIGDTEPGMNCFTCELSCGTRGC